MNQNQKPDENLQNQNEMKTTTCSKSSSKPLVYKPSFEQRSPQFSGLGFLTEQDLLEDEE
jgi:hypothetical protein